MAKVTRTRPREPRPETLIQDRDTVFAGTIRIFRELGITAADLRAWVPWCPQLGELADAMDAGTLAGAR
jgi:hypothetical protein